MGPQSIGPSRSFTTEFYACRKMKKANNRQNIAPTQPLNDVEEELQRLVNGYKKHVGTSKIKSFVTEAISFVKIPEWQKSKHWMVRKQKYITLTR